MTVMNWARALLGTWMLISTVWVVLIGFSLWTRWPVAPPHPKSGTAIYSLWWGDHLLRHSVFAISLPLILFVLGWGLMWILGGFTSNAPDDP